MSGRRLYVGRLDADATRKDVEDYFSTHGPIVDVRLMAGFCFLEYQELKDAEQAVADFSGKEFMNQRLIVEFAKPPRNVDPDREPRRSNYDDRSGGGGYGPPRGYDRPQFDRGMGGGGPRGGTGHRLAVNGVPDNCSWQDLKDFARAAGTVTFADVDRNNPSIGYIEYPARADADEAIRTLSTTLLKGVSVTVEDAPKGAGMDQGNDRGGDRGGDRGYGRDSRDSGRDSYRRDDRDSYRRDDYRDSRDDRRDYGRRDDYSSSRRRSVSPRRRDDRDRRSPPPVRDTRERSPARERERSPAPESGKW